MKRKKVLHIESIHQYDRSCRFGEYLYTPVRRALDWFIYERLNIDIIGCKQPYKDELYLTVKGKMSDIEQAVIKFVASNGNNFTVKY